MYKVTLTGHLLEGIDSQQAITNLAKITKISPEKASKFLDGKERIIKKNLSQEQADKYKTVMTKIGFICKIDLELTLEAIEEQKPPEEVIAEKIHLETQENSNSTELKKPTKTLKQDLAESVRDTHKIFRGIFSIIPIKVWELGMLFILLMGIILIVFSGGSLFPKRYEILYEKLGPKVTCEERYNGCVAGYVITIGNTGTKRQESILIDLPHRAILEHYYPAKIPNAFSEILKEQEDAAVDAMFAETARTQKIPPSKRSSLRKALHKKYRESAPISETFEFGPLEPGKTTSVVIQLVFKNKEEIMHWDAMLQNFQINQGEAKIGDPYGGMIGRVFTNIGLF